jgi:hypothetical protein
MKALAKFLLSVSDTLEFLFFSLITFFQYLQQEVSQPLCKKTLKESFVTTLFLIIACECFTLGFSSYHYKAILLFMFFCIVLQKVYSSFYYEVHSGNNFYRNLPPIHYEQQFFPLNSDVYCLFDSETIKRVTLVAFTLGVYILIALPVILTSSTGSLSAMSLTIAALISDLLYSWFVYLLRKFNNEVYINVYIP